MKILRTSFSQLIREKIIKGQSELLPDPVIFNGIGTHPDIDIGFDGGDFIWGNLVYREEDVIYTDASDNTWLTQGPTGYGPVPTGPGTKPYYTVVTNAKRNETVNQPGIYTGREVTRGVDVMYSQNIPGEFGYGYTYSVGQLEQSYTPSSDPTAKVDMKLNQPHRHVLFTIGDRLYGGLRSTAQIQAAGGNPNDPYDIKMPSDNTNTIAWDADNCLHLCYEDLGNNTCRLMVVRGTSIYDNLNYANLENMPFAVAPMDPVAIPPHDSYGRFMPVHVFMRPDGYVEFRVDTAKFTFNINDCVAKDNSKFVMQPGTTVHGGGCKLFQYGLQTAAYDGGTQHGMERPLVVLANMAINNSDNSNNLGNTGIPPFIAGIPMTPIRRSPGHMDNDNERPKDVIDNYKNANGEDAWIAYTLNGEQVGYTKPLESIVDGQQYNIHGVAAQELSGSLDVVMDYDRIKDRWQKPNNAINATGIEGINVAVNNASIYSPTADEYTLAIKILSDDKGQFLDTDWQPVGTTDNVPYTHTMFLNRYRDQQNNPKALSGWSLQDFEDEVLIRAMTMETKDM